MATNKKAGGVAAPAGIANHCKNTFTRNFAPTWRAVQRMHESRAVALAHAGRSQSPCFARARGRS